MPGFWKRTYKNGEPEHGKDPTRSSFLQSFSSLFKKKTPKPTPVIEDVQTAPLSEAQLQGVSIFPVGYKPAQIGVGTAQSDGKVRDNNEDTLFVFSSILADGVQDLPIGLYIVADGMGGYQHGELASQAATRVVAEVILQRLFLPILAQSSESRNEPLHELMESAVREAQYAVTRQAPGGGTTITAGLVMGDKVIVTQVGDSRGYFIYPDGRCQAITQDHTLVHRLIELGQLTEEEALVHPQRNVLYRAIGQSDPYKPDINTHQVPRPGYMLLCSDGLWGLVSDNEIFRIVTAAANPSAAAHELVEAANRNGGPDNISAIVVQFYM